MLKFGIFLYTFAFFQLMFRLKQLPEDFVVKEISSVIPARSGAFTLAILKKRGLSTPEAAELVASRLGISLQSIGYAGNKDSKALTEQLISIKGDFRNIIAGIKTRKLSLQFAGYRAAPLSLGDLEGNSFVITVRNLRKGELKGISRRMIPNFFGEQRFSAGNVRIGRLIVKKQFSRACALIMKKDLRYGPLLKEYLGLSPNDFVGALRIIPKKVLWLYVHSLQSMIFNKALAKLCALSARNSFLPVVGFGTELKNNEAGRIIDEILRREGLSTRDFIVPQLPELSSEGAERQMFFRPRRLKLSKLEDDELNKGKKKMVLRFTLPKGSYATVAVSSLLKCG
jgi:tRNA pseudouridine13 synthase